MSQATNTIYGDVVTTETISAMKRRLGERVWAMSKLWDVSKFAKKGTRTVQFPEITTESAQLVDVGGEFTAPVGDSTGSTTLEMDKKVGNPFNVQKDKQMQTVVNILKKKSEDAAEQILTTMDTYLLKAMISSVPASAKVNFAGTTANVITKKDFQNARKRLNEKRAPIKGRFCLIGTENESQLYDIPEFVSADKIGMMTRMPIVEGFIGRLFGFDVILVSHMPLVDKAGDVNASAFKNDSCPVIFGHMLAHAWAKQFEETTESLQDLKTAIRYIPWNIFGSKPVVTDYIYQISDKTTADPTS